MPRNRAARVALQRVDLLIGAVLLVAAAGSAIGVVTYEDDRIAAFRVTWPTDDSEVDADAQTLAGPGDLEFSIDVATPNLTRAAWVVTVAGGAARVQDVAIRVEIVSPTNQTQAADATLPAGATASVDVPLEFDLAPVPEIVRVTGPSLDAARGALNATQSSTLGVGAWTVRVSLAPTAPGPLGGTETFTAQPRATLTAYAAELAPETPEVGGR